MNRPLTWIQNDFALANARLFRSLPPPFGSQRWPAGAMLRWRQPVAATPAQQTIQKAVQCQTPLRRSPLPPGTKFFFVYKLAQPRDYSSSFETQLTEARRYLDADKARQCSSRSDRVLGATIFAACSIALACLLTAGATRNSDKAVSVAIAELDHQSPLRSIPTPLPPVAPPLQSRQLSQHIEPQNTAEASTRDNAIRSTAKAGNDTLSIGDRSQAQIDARLPLSRAVHPAMRPSLPKQAEWTTRTLTTDDTAEQVALRDWATQQQRTNTTTGASMPTPVDIGWNARMVQRRITDDADAFAPGSGQR
jgi:hypothetical protein